MISDALSAQTGVHRVPGGKLELFFRKAFLDPETCAAIMARIDARRRPSTIADDTGVAAFRTSETCDLDAGQAAVQDVEARLRALTGIDPAYGEPIQGQRYEAGQEFKAHTDYFEPNGADFARYCAVAGQRTWTVMIYLNEPEEGGATRFRHIDRIIRPETGKLLAWNNLDAAGNPNPWTLHHGMKVRAGTKYVITKWFRQKPWG